MMHQLIELIQNSVKYYFLKNQFKNNHNLIKKKCYLVLKIYWKIKLQVKNKHTHTHHSYIRWEREKESERQTQQSHIEWAKITNIGIHTWYSACNSDYKMLLEKKK